MIAYTITPCSKLYAYLQSHSIIMQSSQTKKRLMKEQQISYEQLEQESSPSHDQSNTVDRLVNRKKNDLEEYLKGIKLSHLLPVARKKRDKQQFEPSFREVHEVYELLSEKLENKNVEKIVKTLYNNLIAKRDQDQPRNRQLKGWEDLIEAKDIQIPQISVKEYSIRPLVRQKKFLRAGDEEKYLQRQIVAKSFVDRQYGLQHLQAQIVESNSPIVIKRQRYTDLAYAVVTEGYRSLEHFLMNECKRSIKPSDKFQMGSLHKILCNCRILLKPEETITFLKFVRLAYNLQSISVTQESAVKLYITLQKQIRARIGNRQLDRSVIKRKWTKYLNMKRRSEFSQQQFNSFVTPAVEKEIIKEYLKTKSISKVKSYLNQKYPERKHLFTLQSVRGVVCKIVRIAIKRVLCYCEKHKHQGLPQLLPIDSSYRCKISKGPESMKIRMQLLKLWLTKDKNILSKLPPLIHDINQFINEQESQRGNYMISKVKPDTSVAEKLDFNINVSRTKLTEGYKLFRKDQVVLKGRESNFQHYINKENGKNLHYYRKVGHSSPQAVAKPDDIKLEDIDNLSSSSNQGSEKNDPQQVKEEADKSISSQDEQGDRTEMLIKEWIERLNLDFFKSLI